MYDIYGNERSMNNVYKELRHSRLFESTLIDFNEALQWKITEQNNVVVAVVHKEMLFSFVQILLKNFKYPLVDVGRILRRDFTVKPYQNNKMALDFIIEKNQFDY